MIVLFIVLYCVGFIVAIRLANWGVGQVVKFFDERKRNKSPYFKIKRKLEDDLSQANFSGDWRKRQEINLKLLWLETYYRVRKNVLPSHNPDHNETSFIAKFSEEEIKFPIKWKLDDFYCYPFSQEIVAAYRKVLVNNAYKGMFKPNNILPVPKAYIIKAIYFISDYLNQKEPIYPVSDKDKLVENLSSINALLEVSFIDTGNDDLPTEAVENYKVGNAFKSKQKICIESDYPKLIDWR